ncbi:MAG: phosphoribosyltransferase family protein [Acidimicrobiales bacterium]
MIYRDRFEAGRLLGESLAPLKADHPVVLALPRGGVPVGAGVASALGAPLDVIVVRKIGVPFHPELALGAIGEHGARFIDTDLARRAGVSDHQIAEVDRSEQAELRRRVERYRDGRPPMDLAGRIAIIVDDGLATGATARVAARIAREQGATRVVIAVPVAPRDTIAHLRSEADDVVALQAPKDFYAVGQWYDNFDQVSDEEVSALLRRYGSEANPTAMTNHESGPGQQPYASPEQPIEREVAIPAAAATLEGHLSLPMGPRGVVLFAHGSGSSRKSPRNQAVAQSFGRASFGTLLFDLLTPTEAQNRHNVFDITLLASRLLAATAWLSHQPEAGDLPFGYFGASTGAAAALRAASEPGNMVGAVVSRGGRPDLAGEHLASVRCPTLLIVGGADLEVLELNRSAAASLTCEHRVVIVPGATHLFEEPGALEAVARLATSWFSQHLA